MKSLTYDEAVAELEYFRQNDPEGFYADGEVAKRYIATRRGKVVMVIVFSENGSETVVPARTYSVDYKSYE